MAGPIIVEVEVAEGATNNNVGRILKPDREQLLQSEFDDWDLHVYEGRSPTPILSSTGNLKTATNADGGAVFSDTLSTDGHWANKDKFGYNFRHTVAPALVITEGGKRYRFEYTFNSSTYDAVPATFIWVVRGRRRL